MKSFKKYNILNKNDISKYIDMLKKEMKSIEKNPSNSIRIRNLGMEISSLYKELYKE